MRSIEAFFDDTQKLVTGEVTLRLSEGTFSVDGITSAHDLMRSSFATYGEENRAWSGEDAKGFSTMSALATSLWTSVNGASR